MTVQKPIKKRDREGSIKKLLAAGVKVFSEYGYDAATTKLIAKYADMNEALISRYFDGKAGLLVEIIRDSIEKEKESGAKHSYPEGETVEKEILNFFAFKQRHYVDMNQFFRVLFTRSILDPKVAKELQRKTCKGLPPLLLERLDGLQKKGLIRQDVNIERMCFVINNSCFSIGFLGPIVMGLSKDGVNQTLKEFAACLSRGLA